MNQLDSFCFIDADWLNAVSGGIFFYPAAGTDVNAPIAALHEHIKEFWFCDLYLPRSIRKRQSDQLIETRLLYSSTKGVVDAEIETRLSASGSEYRYIEPSYVTETYGFPDGHQIRVVRRRGFGQIALTTEFLPNSLSVFMHRGDSPGDSGSNVYFLANKQSQYSPCGNLFAKLAQQLTNKSLIISDGSNSRFRWLRKFHSKHNISGREAYGYHNTRPDIIFGGFKWKCVGWLNKRYGPTLVWGLERIHFKEI